MGLYKRQMMEFSIHITHNETMLAKKSKQGKEEEKNK